MFMSQTPLTAHQNITPPSSFTDPPLTPPPTDEKPFAHARTAASALSPRLSASTSRSPTTTAMTTPSPSPIPLPCVSPRAFIADQSLSPRSESESESMRLLKQFLQRPARLTVRNANPSYETTTDNKETRHSICDTSGGWCICFGMREDSKCDLWGAPVIKKMVG
ncbi:hypothetical protein BU26DRAFT_78368 [Trematosphaeria pertusa]|uniref:Uncharacterized protein n=1 Tax=Trematosphaeria pertusa TaxID=390896 RepID=A0A6A6I4F8_9PLEO|nr:uncharacterized protein BU26DRAFT_78368 [Trematosphaeria pertusa]KAF2245186.1 hypothetical protein BU26DRAFT_78368 [Trematosphaeria pertusa]